MPDEILPKDPDKTYGLMEIVEGTTPLDEKDPEDTVFTFPHLVLRELVCIVILSAALLLISLFFNAPLEELANVAKTPNPAKAPWYFLGLQEMVSHSALIGGIIMPTLFVAGLILLPYLDTSVGRRLRDRKLTAIIFTIFLIANLALIIIGTYMRGPNWVFYLPWNMPSPGGH